MAGIPHFRLPPSMQASAPKECWASGLLSSFPPLNLLDCCLFAGHSLGQGANGTREDALSQLSRTELSLTLSSKYGGVEAEAEGEAGAERLWLRWVAASPSSLVNSKRVTIRSTKSLSDTQRYRKPVGRGKCRILGRPQLGLELLSLSDVTILSNGSHAWPSLR